MPPSDEFCVVNLDSEPAIAQTLHQFEFLWSEMTFYNLKSNGILYMHNPSKIFIGLEKMCSFLCLCYA